MPDTRLISTLLKARVALADRTPEPRRVDIVCPACGLDHRAIEAVDGKQARIDESHDAYARALQEAERRLSEFIQPWESLERFNPNHDPRTGRFSETAGGGLHSEHPDLIDAEQAYRDDVKETNKDYDRQRKEIEHDYAKIAKDMAGMAQNQVESHIAQNFHDLPIAVIHHVVKGGAGLLMDYAHDMIPADFKRDFGLSFNDFCDKVRLIIHAPKPDADYIMKNLPKGARELMTSLQRHQLAPTDLLRVDQWGDVRHHAVIVDYGLTHQVYDDHYKARQQAAQAARQQQQPKKPDPFAKQAPQQPVPQGATAPKPPAVRIVKPQPAPPRQASKLASVYSGYCPICGQPGCLGECASPDGAAPDETFAQEA